MPKQPLYDSGQTCGLNALIVHFLFNTILQREIILNICSESAIHEQKIDQIILVLQATPTQINTQSIVSTFNELLLVVNSFYSFTVRRVQPGPRKNFQPIRDRSLSK